MSSLRSEMLDHLLDKFEEKDKAILRKMIKTSLENDNEADLALRVFKTVFAYIDAHSTLSPLEATALDSIQETLANLAQTAKAASVTNVSDSLKPTQPNNQGSRTVNEAQGDTSYTHFGRENGSRGSIEPPKSAAHGLAAELAKTQLDDQPASVDSSIPKSSTVGYGMKLMMKNGWKPGQGLGVRGDGITEPVLSSDQLVPDRKDYNPGVGFQGRVEHQSTVRNLSASTRASSVQRQYVGLNLQGTTGQVTGEKKKPVTGSVKSDEKTAAWECTFDQDPLLSKSTPRHPNSYFNGW